MKKIKKINLLAISLMYINAFFSIPVLIYYLYKYKKINCVLFGILFFILGFCFVPSSNLYDIARLYNVVEQLKVVRIREEIEFFKYSKDFYLPALILMIYHFKLIPNIIGGVAAFIVYYFLFKSFNLGIKNKNLSKKQVLVYFFIYLSIIPIIGYTGLRFLPSIAVLVFGIIGYLKENTKIYLIYIFISPFMHFSLWVLVALFILSFLLPKLKENKLKIVGIISFLLGQIDLNKVIVIILNEINKIKPLFNHSTYITGAKYGSKYGIHESLTGILGAKLQLMIVLTILFIALFNIKRINKFKMLVSIYIIFVFLLQNNGEPFYRYGNFLIYIIFLLNISNKFLKRKSYSVNLLYFFILFHGIFMLVKDIRFHWLSLFISYNNIIKLSLLNVVFKIITGIN